LTFPLRIAFYTEGLPFDGSPLERQPALGGGEGALWFMAHELVSRGHDVDVFCRCPNPGTYDGVSYRDVFELRKMGPSTEWDLFIASRYAHALYMVAHANELAVAARRCQGSQPISEKAEGYGMPADHWLVAEGHGEPPARFPYR
jgi:hypothetical protein